MTDAEIEKDADECWALWRRKAREAGIDVAEFSEVDIWHHAYRCGIELGIELENKACSNLVHDLADNNLDRKWSNAYRNAACEIAARIIDK